MITSVNTSDASEELLYDVYWEGPFDWENLVTKAGEHHVLYQIYGHHLLYGDNVLLYIGCVISDHIAKRVYDHQWVLKDDMDEKPKIRLGSIAEFTSWKDWYNNPKNYTRASSEVTQKIEALLIFVHQPIYNNKNKNWAENARGFRIFNSGKRGHLLSEVSFNYWCGD